jgi:hypothetical protein
VSSEKVIEEIENYIIDQYQICMEMQLAWVIDRDFFLYGTELLIAASCQLSLVKYTQQSLSRIIIQSFSTSLHQILFS